MSRKRSGLGKGLDALIPQGSGFQPIQSSSSGVIEVPITGIKPNPRQPRINFDTVELDELTASIKEHGIIQPLIVSRGTSPEEYILIAGERRWLAAKKAGFNTVPVILRETNDQDRLELALIENIQRSDLGPLERAEAYRQLTDEFGLPHEEIGKRVGKSRVTITNTLRLLGLPASIQNAITANVISEGHARALLSLPSPQSQIAALQTIRDKGLNVRQTEELVHRLAGEKPVSKPKIEPVPEVKAIEERLRTRLGTKVTLKHGRKGGTITIHYYSSEELDSLLENLLKEL
jgi:ParB family chromosome partitioning protein